MSRTDDVNVNANQNSPLAPGSFAVEVNGAVVRVCEPVADARRILESADLEPADNYVLIELLRRECRAIGLDETVDLGSGDKKIFRAFRSDRIFRFTVDERGYDWGDGIIEEEEVRRVSGIPDDEVLVLDREGEEERVIQPGERIDLSRPGTEHFRSLSRLITVYLNGEEQRIPRGVYTTERLISIFKIEPGYKLDVLKGSGELVTLKLNEHLRVREGMQFFSQAPSGTSS